MEMKIIDILRLCPYDKIEKKLILHYGNKSFGEYEKLYHKLISMEINKLSCGELYIYITAYQENEEDSFSVNDFCEDDTSLYYDVSAYGDFDSNITYSIAALCYSDFLQYSIDTETLKHFSIETILAHCFWEITSYKFEDNL
jgi:hypothetical protein